MNDPVWVTNDGRHMVIKWMTSRHLVNSFNMMMRKWNMLADTVTVMARQVSGGAQILCFMRDEIQSRQLYHWSDSKQPAQLIAADVPREDHKTLCMLRAILDTRPKGLEDIIELFHRNPASYTEHVLNCADPKWHWVKIKFTQYRLMPPVNP